MGRSSIDSNAIPRTTLSCAQGMAEVSAALPTPSAPAAPLHAVEGEAGDGTQSEGHVFRLSSSLVAKALRRKTGIWVTDCMAMLQQVGLNKTIPAGHVHTLAYFCSVILTLTLFTP